MVKADVVVDGNRFYNLIKKYENISEILDSYINHLHSIIVWYEGHKDYCKRDENGEMLISSTEYAQYRFMRDVFPEDRWNKEKKLFCVENGSSSGRPWTELSICSFSQYGNDKKSWLFWRVDTDTKGPYISLRYYEDFDKKNELEQATHNRIYNHLVNSIKSIVENHEMVFCWDSIKDGYRGNYKESSLIRIGLNEYLKEWGTFREPVVTGIRYITDEVVKIAL